MPMFFLAPIYLLGLLSLPIPFILHLFEKRRVKQVDFPWLYLVEESIKGGNLFLRLREWILLALRTLVLLFLVVAFASPIVRRDRGVILIDDSYDMFSRRGDGILFDEAKGIAEKIAREKGYDIVLSSGRQYKDDILPSYMMLQPLEVEDENIVFITSKEIPQEGDVIIIEGEPNIISIDTVYLKDPLPQVGTDNLIYVGVTNHGEHEIRRNVFIDLFQDSSYKEVLFPPGQIYFSIPIEFHRSGTFSGYVDIGDDGLNIDNIYYFSFKIPDEITVGIVGQDSSSSFYIERALSPGGVETAVELSKSVYPTLPFTDIIIFLNVPYIENNMPSIVFKEGGFMNRTNDFYFSFKNIDRTHPIFSVFDDACIDELTTRKIYRRSIDNIKGRSIVYFSDGRQAVVEDEVNMFFHFLPSIENTDLVLSPNFPPILHRTIRYLKDGGDYPVMIHWGRDIRVSVNENRTYEINNFIRDERWKISPLPDENTLFLDFSPPYPGIYVIDEVGEVAVNISRMVSTAAKFKESTGMFSLKRWFFLICLIFVFMEMVVRNLRP